MKQVVWITAIFEFFLAVMLVISIGEGVSYWAFTAFFSILLMAVPILLSSKNIIQLPWPIVMSIGLAFALHNLGLVTNWYDTTFWWDKITHLVSGVVIASLVAIEMLLLDQRTESIYIPPIWYIFLVPIAILTLEALWEIVEFSADSLTQVGMQHSLGDTANDIVTNLLSGLIGGLGVFYYLRRHSADEFLSNLRADKLVKWFVVRFGEPGKL
ncbi:MAG: hypothetical protein SA339_03880 [Methanomassiliicoccus sp.]|nr:hypothetical protein [Methanomassiliicoccus sp.]